MSAFMQKAFQKNIKVTWPLLLIPLAFVLSQHLGYAINLTQSLPQKVWLVVFKKIPKRGDYILFKAVFNEKVINHNVPRETLVIKQILGVPGDVITRIHQDFFVNHQYSATAKTLSLSNKPLIPGPTGILRQGQYYVFSPHKDSLDSRYQMLGWVGISQIIGVAYPLW